MRFRRISQEEAILVITSPDSLTTGGDGKLNALKTVAGRLIRAVYVVEDDKTIVVTITRD
ncbi:MAG TPA: hypothetical protein VIR57_14235 [Chloroflexota bacterium]|jgi:hypothetical protein